MAFIEAELEQLLKEAGKRLSHPPNSVDELLPFLDQVGKLLLEVDQCPKMSMLEALKPLMRALIRGSLSGHSDADVKVAVASCITEITRITAPDAPYTYDQMRDVFQLIVSSFEGLADQSGRSYNKRASILKTVSNIRSCVIMIDLECDGLIVEMFEHFLRSVRDYHLESIYSSMENIMVLVLEETEEITVEMLKPILACVKKNSEGVLPIARKLGEGVLLKSAAKLKPYLMPAIVSIGDTLDMYTQVVASVCESDGKKVKQGKKRKVESKIVEDDEDSDSDSKDDGKKHGSGKAVTEKDQTKSLSGDDGMSQENLPILPSDVIELQKLVIKGEMSLSQKEQENTALREQVRQSEVRWSEHEIKMKSLEETWQKQMASLQSLAAAKKSVGAPSSDSGDGISGTQNAVKIGNSGGVVDHLSKELEQKRHYFDDNAEAVIELKYGGQQMPYLKQMEELRKVEERFEMWKKEYKNQLRETRAKLVKGVNGEGGGQNSRVV